MSNYPDGSDTKDSPWNKPEPKPCPECGGKGELEIEDEDVEVQWITCGTCQGSGIKQDEEEI